MNFTMVARCSGPLAKTSLRAALDAVQNQHPFLQVRIEQTPAGPVFRSANVPRIPLLMVDDSKAHLSLDPEVISTWIEEELVHSIAWEQGPLVRCTWVRHTEELHHLLFTFHHAIGDGMSGVFLLRDLLQAMEAGAAGDLPDKKPTPQTLPLALDQRYPHKAKGWRGFLLTAKTIVYLLRKDRRYGPIAQIPVDSKAEPDSHKTHLFIHPFDANFTSRLREQAKEHNTTVHCALSAAMSLVMAAELELGDSKSLLHRSAVNVRRELEPAVDDEVGLFVSMLFYRERLTGSEDLWEIARSIKQQHQLDREKDIPFAIGLLMPVLYRLVRGEKLSDEELARRWKERTPETLGLTNLGVIDLPSSAGELEIESFYFAVSPSSQVDFVSTVTTFNGQLTWNFIAPCRVFEKFHAQQLVDKIVARLREAIGPQRELKEESESEGTGVISAH